MANPQKEHGFAPIANTILEAVYSSSFSSTELPIILWVWRNVYGYKGRYVVQFTWTKIAAAILSDKSHVRKVGLKLVADKVLFIGSDGRIGFQKDYDEWVSCSRNRSPATYAVLPNEKAPRTRFGGRRSLISTVEPKERKESLKEITAKPTHHQFESSAEIDHKRRLDRQIEEDIRISERTRLNRLQVEKDAADYAADPRTPLTPEEIKKFYRMSNPRPRPEQ